MNAKYVFLNLLLPQLLSRLIKEFGTFIDLEVSVRIVQHFLNVHFF